MRSVLYLSHATPDVYAIIAAAVPPGFRLLTLERDSDEERRAKIAECEVAVVAASGLRKPVIDAARKLELVHHQGVGWQDTTDHALLRSRGIPLALTPEGTTVGVAEHTVLLILAALKRLPYADASAWGASRAPWPSASRRSAPAASFSIPKWLSIRGSCGLSCRSFSPKATS